MSKTKISVECKIILFALVAELIFIFTALIPMQERHEKYNSFFPKASAMESEEIIKEISLNNISYVEKIRIYHDSTLATATIITDGETIPFEYDLYTSSIYKKVYSDFYINKFTQNITIKFSTDVEIEKISAFKKELQIENLSKDEKLDMLIQLRRLFNYQLIGTNAEHI